MAKIERLQFPTIDFKILYKKIDNFLSLTPTNKKLFLSFLRKIGYADLHDYVDFYLIGVLTSGQNFVLKNINTISHLNIPLDAITLPKRMMKIAKEFDKFSNEEKIIPFKIETSILKIFYLEYIAAFPKNMTEILRENIIKVTTQISMLDNNIVQMQKEREKDIIDFLKNVPIINIEKQKAGELQLKWSNGNLSALSKFIYIKKFTKKPTDFQKVFTEQKPAIWIANDFDSLAFLLYKLHEENLIYAVRDNKREKGYLAAAEKYFSDNAGKIAKNSLLSDRLHKIRKNSSNYNRIISFADEAILKTK